MSASQKHATPLDAAARYQLWAVQSLPALALRLACAVAVVCLMFIAAQFAGARHAGWVAAGAGLPAAGVAFLLAGNAPPRAPPHFAIAPRAALVAAVATGLFLLVLMPILVTPLPAMDDYPNHLARVHMMLVAGKDALLDRYYAIHWRVIPNLGLELVVPPLAAATTLYFAGKAFLVLIALLSLGGPLAIHQALYRRLSFGPLLAALFLYNGVTTMGVLNYQFGIGLALFAVAGWIRLREANRLLRGGVSAACMVVLFFCHMMALGCYGLAIGSFELWALMSRPAPMRRRLGDAAALVLPCAIVVPLLLLGPVPDGSYATPTRWGGLHARLDGLRFVFETYSPWIDLLMMLAIVAGLLWAVRRRRVFLHPFGWIALAVFGAVYLVIPNQIQGTWGAADRLPVAALLLLIGTVHWDLGSVRARTTFLAVVALLALVRTAEVQAAFSRYAQVTRDFRASLRLIEPGSRVLVADQYENSTDELAGSIQQLPMLAMIERSSLVSLAYAHPLQQIMRVRPAYAASTGGYADQPLPLDELLAPTPHFPPGQEPWYAPSGRVYWADWPHSYDYVYVIDRTAPGSPAPDRLALLYQGDRFQLFRVTR